MAEILQLLAAGFAIAFEPQNLMLIIGGCALGLFIGAMPGLGSVNGVAILLPLTFLVPPTGAVIFLAAIYYGAMYGGAVSSVMLGIPGASTAVATTFDGRPLAKQGLADKALTAAAVASSSAGVSAAAADSDCAVGASGTSSFSATVSALRLAIASPSLTRSPTLTLSASMVPA